MSATVRWWPLGPIIGLALVAGLLEGPYPFNDGGWLLRSTAIVGALLLGALIVWPDSLALRVFALGFAPIPFLMRSGQVIFATPERVLTDRLVGATFVALAADLIVLCLLFSTPRELR